MAGNTHEGPLIRGEVPPDGNLVFAFIARNQALLTGFEVEHLGAVPLPVTTSPVAVASDHGDNRIEGDGEGHQELFQ